MVSCTTQGTNWDVDAYAPVAETTLDLSKLVGDNNMVVAGDSSVWLNIDESIYTFDMDTIKNIPSMVSPYEFVWTLGDYTMPAGTAIPTQAIPITMEMGDIKLRTITLQGGTLTIDVKSTATERLAFKYTIPAASRFGIGFEYRDTVPGLATGQDTVYYKKEFDVSGYELLLTGPANDGFNNFEAYLDVTSISGDPDISILDNQVVFKINNELENIQPYYGKGYLGQYNFDQNNLTADVDALAAFQSGILDVEQLSLDLIVHNTVGADIRFKPNLLQGENSASVTTLALTHPQMGTTANINRAFETGNPSDPIVETLYTYSFNSGNSNIENLVELLPDQITFDAQMDFNPYGNIGGYTDFYFADHPPYVQMQLSAPLKFSVSQLYFLDTIANPFAAVELVDNIKGGEFIMRVENKFPLAIKLQLFTIDRTGVVTDSLMVDDLVPAAPVNASNRVENPVNADLIVSAAAGKIDNLKQAEKIQIKAVFNTQPTTAGRLQMYSDYYLKLKLIADIKFNIEL